MNRLGTAVNDMRLNRKRYSISESLLPLVLLLVLLVAQTSGRPSSVNETTKHDVKPATSDHNDGIDDTMDDAIDDVPFDAGDEYLDVDNVEWHHVKIVDGIMHEDHPVVMYKEDFVSEDYDPSQQRASSDESSPRARRKYKVLQRHRASNRTEETQPQAQALEQQQQQHQQQWKQNEEADKYHALKPEKMYFDILPPTPVVVTDDSSINDSKFDPANIHFKVISMLHAGDDEDAGNDSQSSSSIRKESEMGEDNDSPDDGGAPSKESLQKRPKKYHRRIRRDTGRHYDEASHMVFKRHPRYTYERVGSNSFDDYDKHQRVNYWGQKHAVAGNKWNGIDGDVPAPPPLPSAPIGFGNRFGGEDNTDRVIWGVRKVGSRRPPTTRPQSSVQEMPNFPSLIHNSNPDDADFSVFTTRRPAQSSNRRPGGFSRPQQSQMPQLPPLIHNSNPEDADFSVFNIPPRRKQPLYDHKTFQRSSIAKGVNAANAGIHNDATPSANDVFESYDGRVEEVFETNFEHKSIAVNDEAAQCEQATNSCCDVTELSGLYGCFNHANCTRSIAQITKLCALN